METYQIQSRCADKNVMVVYLIASHTNPEQVVRLVKTLKAGSPETQVVIHHDYYSSHLDPSNFSSLNNVHLFENYIAVEWGGISQVTMILNAMEWINSNLEYDWLVFISGQDYPIQPLRRIEGFLAKSEYDGFMSAVPVNNPRFSIIQRSEEIMRYYYRHYELPSILKKLSMILSIINDFQNLILLRSNPRQPHPRIGIRRFGTLFNTDFRCYKGSEWFTLSRKCIEHIQKFLTRNPGYITYYKRAYIPDESFFHTILFNDNWIKILNNNKRYISWTGENYSHPDILTVRDFYKLIDSGQHFGRKFDIHVDDQILNVLDKYLEAQS